MYIRRRKTTATKVLSENASKRLIAQVSVDQTDWLP
jgi:hypothetical protein